MSAGLFIFGIESHSYPRCVVLSGGPAAIADLRFGRITNLVDMLKKNLRVNFVPMGFFFFSACECVICFLCEFKIFK